MIELLHRCTRVALGVRQKQPNTRNPNPLARERTAATHLCHHWGPATAMPRSGMVAVGHYLMPWKELQPVVHHQQLKPNSTKKEIFVLGEWGTWEK